MHLTSTLFRPSLLASVLAHGVAFVAAVVFVASSEPEPRGAVAAWVAFAPSPAEPSSEAAAASEAPPALPESPSFEVPPSPPDLSTVDAVAEDALPEIPEAPGVMPVPAPRTPSPTARVPSRRPPAAPPAPPRAAPSVAPRSTERAAVLTPPEKLTTNRPPVYPGAARAQGIEGVVYLWVTIEADGSVSSASIATSSGHSLLDESALEAARGWRYLPARADGVPLRTTQRQPVTFRLS